jgi:hypothetical protein
MQKLYSQITSANDPSDFRTLFRIAIFLGAFAAIVIGIGLLGVKSDATVMNETSELTSGMPLP